MKSVSWPWAIAVVLAASLAPPAFAGAWTQQEGQGLVIVNAQHSRADNRFDARGRSRPAAGFAKTELRAYVEYGLTDWATLVAQPELRRKESGGEEVTGLGRVDAGLRVRLWRDDASVVSVQASGRMPGASDRLAPLNGGDTDWEADARVLYGRGFPLFGRHAFADAQLGYRVRFGDPADEMRFDLTAGIDVTPKLLALVQSFNSLSVGDADPPFTRTREHKLSASAVYRPGGPWSFQIGALLTVAGSEALEERGVILGVWRSF